jgi:hypothetical protein
MIYVVLYLVGGMLFVNGLFMVGKITNLPGVVVYNLLVGVFISIMGVWIIAKDNLNAFGETVSLVAGATCLTFGFAYLMIALEGLTLVLGLKIGADFSVLGWYCLPMSICVLSMSLGWYQALGSKLPKVPQFGIMWLLWAICFFLFFLVFGAGVGALKALTGIVIIIVGIITCSYTSLANFQAGKVGQW